MKKHLTLFLLFISIGFFQNMLAQSATTTINFTGFQACGGCTVCGSDYWCFNTSGSYCGNTAPCGSQTFSDPCPPGNIVTSVTVNYFSADCAGGSMTASINGNAVPTVNEGSTGCWCSNSPCAQSASSSSTYPCGLSGYVNGGSNTLQMCTGSSVCINRLELVFTYAPLDQATPATQTVTPVGPTSVCAGTSYTYSVPVVNASNYTWTVPPGWTINSGQGTNLITATPGSAGNVCVLASNLCGSTAQSCLAVTLSTASIAADSASANPNPICPSTATTLSVNGGSLGDGASWNWFSGSCNGTLIGTGPSVTVTPASSTTYYVGAIGTCNSTACAPVFVNVSGITPAPGAPAGNASVCDGSTQTYTTAGSFGATSYNWTVPGGAVINSGQGTTSISVTFGSSSGSVCVDATGPCGTSAPSCTSITITTLPVATFSYTGTPYCQNAANPSPAFSGGGIAGTFTSSPVGLSINPATGTVDLATSTPGTYTVTNSIAAVGGCIAVSATTSITITAFQVGTFSYFGTPYCQNDPNPAPVFSGGGVAGTFTATPAGLSINAGTGVINLAASTAGTYAVNNTINGAGCPSVISSSVITINANPTITNTTSAQSICSQGTASFTPTSNVTGTIFNWTAGSSSGTVTGFSSSGSGNISEVLTNSGTSPASVTYIITPTGPPPSSCAGSGTFMYVVTVNPLPSADSSSIIISTADCGVNTGSISGLTVVSGQGPFTYLWKDSLGNTVGTNLNLTNVGAGHYTLTITDANTCSTQFGNGNGISITASPEVIAAFTANPITGETPLTVNFLNGSTGATNYLWQFGTGDTSLAANPTYIYIPLGNFKICLMATNAIGCADTVCSTIDVFINSAFIVPNVFTPNGDNVNDIFAVHAKGLKTMDAEIYNRWGEKEYEWHTTSGGWDGRTASGVPSPSGSYYYIIKATGIDEKEYFEKGSFTLVR